MEKRKSFRKKIKNKLKRTLPALAFFGGVVGFAGLNQLMTMADPLWCKQFWSPGRRIICENGLNINQSGVDLVRDAIGKKIYNTEGIMKKILLLEGHSKGYEERYKMKYVPGYNSKFPQMYHELFPTFYKCSENNVNNFGEGNK